MTTNRKEENFQKIREVIKDKTDGIQPMEIANIIGESKVLTRYYLVDLAARGELRIRYGVDGYMLLIYPAGAI